MITRERTRDLGYAVMGSIACLRVNRDLLALDVVLPQQYTLYLLAKFLTPAPLQFLSGDRSGMTL